MIGTFLGVFIFSDASCDAYGVEDAITSSQVGKVGFYDSGG